jgi:hypothetical protein
MDDITAYRSDTEYWAAQCAMDGIREAEELPDPDLAADYLSEVWGFVEAMADEAGLPVPDQAKATALLKEEIIRYLEDVEL